MKQYINEARRMQQLAGVIKENENPSPNYNELVNAMETALKNYIKNAKGDPNVTLGGQLSTEEGEVVAKLVNLIKQVKQDSKYTVKSESSDMNFDKISASDIKVGTRFKYRSPRLGEVTIEISEIETGTNGKVSVYYKYTDRSSQGPYLLPGDSLQKVADFLDNNNGKKI
jgi:hypothetical protein